jgi:hypothetical protein
MVNKIDQRCVRGGSPGWHRVVRIVKQQPDCQRENTRKMRGRHGVVTKPSQCARQQKCTVQYAHDSRRRNRAASLQ